MSNYPPGVTTKMIDDHFGNEDEGTEIDTLEGGIVLVYRDGSSIVFQLFDRDQKLIDEFSLRVGAAQWFIGAIQERL